MSDRYKPGNVIDARKDIYDGCGVTYAWVPCEILAVYETSLLVKSLEHNLLDASPFCVHFADQSRSWR